MNISGSQPYFGMQRRPSADTVPTGASTAVNYKTYVPRRRREPQSEPSSNTSYPPPQTPVTEDVRSSKGSYGVFQSKLSSEQQRLRQERTQQLILAEQADKQATKDSHQFQQEEAKSLWDDLKREFTRKKFDEAREAIRAGNLNPNDHTRVRITNTIINDTGKTIKDSTRRVSNTLTDLSKNALTKHPISRAIA